jgi:hypothetical protein
VLAELFILKSHRVLAYFKLFFSWQCPFNQTIWNFLNTPTSPLPPCFFDSLFSRQCPLFVLYEFGLCKQWCKNCNSHKFFSTLILCLSGIA